MLEAVNGDPSHAFPDQLYTGMEKVFAEPNASILVKLVEGIGVGLGEGVGDGIGVGLVVGVGDGAGVGVGVADATGVGLGVGDGLVVGAGVGVGEGGVEGAVAETPVAVAIAAKALGCRLANLAPAGMLRGEALAPRLGS